MQSPVLIEQMKLSEKDGVLKFLRIAYPENPRLSDPVYWDWRFAGSPYCDPDDLPIWLAKIDGRIAGQLASVPVEFNAGDETVRAIWIVDLVVDPDFRRRGIARKLVRASLDHCPFVLGVNAPEHPPKMLAALGWNAFTVIPRYQKILFPGNAIRQIARFRSFANAFNLAFAPVRTGYPSWPNVKRLERFDESFDELWVEARGQWPCSVTRSSASLDWQYVRQPGKKFEILACTDGDSLRGYVVMSFGGPNTYGAIEKAAITDICYAPTGADETITKLLDEAVKLAIEREVGSIVTDVIDERLEKRLKFAGFWRVKSDLQLQANVPPNREVVYDAANWYLTRGDLDISLFESLNVQSLDQADHAL